MTSSDGAVTVAEVVAALAAEMPLSWAEEWDRVGLVVGEPGVRVTRALVTLDATAEAVDRAAASGAEILVTHHPPFLTMPETIRRGPGPGGALEAALRREVAIVSMHTNLDRSPRGAEALARALGLAIEAPLEAGLEPVSVVVTYVPRSAERTVREAMTAAGAGRVGEYDGCAFSSEGTGRFSPRAGARPRVESGADGIDEVRVEMLAPRSAAGSVVAAAAAAHPYEEPVVTATDGWRARGAARLGRLCSWGGGTVDALATQVSRRLGAPVRVWGSGDAEVQRIAVANGSGGSLIGAAAGAADVMVTGEVRYHDALDALAGGLAIIEAGHDATEWPLADALADVLSEVAPTVSVGRENAYRPWRMMEAR